MVYSGPASSALEEAEGHPWTGIALAEDTSVKIGAHYALAETTFPCIPV